MCFMLFRGFRQMWNLATGNHEQADEEEEEDDDEEEEDDDEEARLAALSERLDQICAILAERGKPVALADMPGYWRGKYEAVTDEYNHQIGTYEKLIQALKEENHFLRLTTNEAHANAAKDADIQA